MKNSLQSKWLKHLKTKQERENFSKTLLNRTDDIILKRLLQLLKEDYATAVSVSSSDYDSPAWMYKLAENNGEKKVLRELIDLLSFVNGPTKQ